MENNQAINIEQVPTTESSDVEQYYTDEKAIDEAKNKPKENVYKLIKPITFEGEYITEVVMNLEDLSGRDLEEAAESLTAYQKTGILENEKAYLAAVAAKSMNMPVPFMQYLKAKDYTELTLRVQNFLLV